MQPAAQPAFDVSVVTACYNSAKTIERTIDSVQAATGPWRIQHCFADGGSTDGTVDIIRRRMRPGDRILSEPDDGISDAFNKGVGLAEGAYVHILNSDDWVAPDFWDILLGASQDKTVPMLHSDALFYAEGKPFRLVKGSPDYHQHLDHCMRGIGHPCLLAHRAIFEQIGRFDTGLRYSMDLEWLQRAHDNGYTSVYVPGAVAHYLTDGNSSGGGGMEESLDLARKRGVPAWRIALLRAGRVLRLRAHKTLTGLRARAYKADAA
ncbi:MAG: glycosyltransferase family 2 protein [Pseudomonadota bacterium]